MIDEAAEFLQSILGDAVWERTPEHLRERHRDKVKHILMLAGEGMPFKPVTISALQAEITRAVAKHGFEQTPLNPARTDESNLAILVEEVGEVARAMTYDEGEKDKLVAELIQTAAMALAWAQAVDERG